ncbi:thiopurine S-methyltransferase [Hyaloraphidium curvatum]|nr:thiopurine S-methyltransferase [Hyaloraphidium curvatum]
MSSSAPSGDRDPARLKDWDARWRDGRIGFHKSDVNNNLVRWIGELRAPGNAKPRVFVPLCGKSLDLPYLAREGFDVTGLEWSRKACLDFFAEQGIAFASSPVASRTVPTPEYKPELYAAKDLPLRIIQDDLFAAELPPSDCIYDRASMIAVLPSLREKYADTILSCLEPGGRILAVTLERPVPPDVGPPFTLLEEDFRRIYEARGCEVKRLAVNEVESGTTGPGTRERVFLVVKP